MKKIIYMSDIEKSVSTMGPSDWGEDYPYSKWLIQNKDEVEFLSIGAWQVLQSKVLAELAEKIVGK